MNERNIAGKPLFECDESLPVGNEVFHTWYTVTLKGFRKKLQVAWTYFK